jgi:hypothetical protein
MATQFRKGKLYRFSGIRWDPRTQANQSYDVIVIGELVRSTVDPIRRERDCKGEFLPDDRIYRLDDGHLPDHQPRVSGLILHQVMGPQKIRFAFSAG